LDTISFVHISKVLSLLRTVLHSTSEPEIISTIFGDRIITHDDVILALPWIVHNTAPYAQTTSEQMMILSLLCDLVVAEHNVATRRTQELPNDGKRAKTVLPRIITGGPEFRSNFDTFAFEKAGELLEAIRSQENIFEDQKLHLDALVKPLLCVEQQHTLFDERVVKIQRWFITPDQSEWRIRHSLRETIKEILLDQKLQPIQAVVLWNLLAYAHGQINQAFLELSRGTSALASHCKAFRAVLIQDLEWVVNFLNSHHNLDIQELTAARELWNWHYQFDKDGELKAIAEQCDNFFKNSELFPQYALLLSWRSYEALEQWATETKGTLINSKSSLIIHDFVQNGIKFLGNSDRVSQLFIVAEKLGSDAQRSQAVQSFVEEALKLAIQDPEFQFASRLCRSWVWTARHNDSSTAIAVLKRLLQLVNTKEKVVQLIQVIYESAWLTNITEPEVTIVLEQREHFLEANLAVRFLGLLGGLFFSSSEQVKGAVEKTFNELDREQLSSGLDAFLQSLDYALRSLSQNIESAVAPSLRIWILDQVLRLPDIDDIGGTTDWHLQELLKLLGKPDLQWLISAVEKRIQFSESYASSMRTLPSRERLSQWINPISLEQADDPKVQSLIAKLLSYADSSRMLGYSFPRYLVDVDPAGAIAADLVVEKLTDPKVKGDPREVWQWAKFAGYYPNDSSAWHKIAHEACFLAVQFDDRHKSSIFHALTNPDPKTWIVNIGEVSPTFEQAVKMAEQQLKAETDPVLIPFRQWILHSAQLELSSEVERVNEEIEE
jgi:hypothetical protein